MLLLALICWQALTPSLMDLTFKIASDVLPYYLNKVGIFYVFRNIKVDSELLNVLSVLVTSYAKYITQLLVCFIFVKVYY